MAKWDKSKSAAFWAERVFQSIISDEYIPDKREKQKKQNDSRQEMQCLYKTQFHDRFKQFMLSQQSRKLPGPVIAENLRFWIEHLSWTYCNSCKMLKMQRLLPNYFKRPLLKFSKECTCIKNVYINPTEDKIPDVLKGLTHKEMVVLRPLTVHIGDYVKKQNGYRQKTNLFRLTWSTNSVLEKINDLTCVESRNRCIKAYDFLMQNELSSYKTYVEMRETEINESKRFNVYDFSKNVGIECALWPNLYPTIDFCETSLTGRSDRASTKAAFMVKAFSQISDYGTSFELLQFHYDLWVFKTVSGAITTARKKYCTPARALDAKTFSADYWRWHNYCLIDAVRQFGPPTLFLTISPSEWSFPLPPWLKALQEKTGLGETELPAYETLHFVNVLEQLVRGYMCGSNDNRWKSHLFSHCRKTAHNNVVNYFYRFEFQKRGTVHMHVLVWLKNLQQTHIEHVRADIPWGNPESAYLVYSLQKSDKGSLSINENDTNVETNNGVSTLKICHPAEAFAHNIRGYISTILPALQCRMDVQCSDGHGMLLKYVSSYVTKAHDAYNCEALYTIHTTPYQAAFRYLKEMSPLEPEMWLSLSSKKIAWTPHRLKHFSVPLPDFAENNKTLQAYWSRPKSLERLSLLQWLRQVDTSKTQPVVYKNGKTLVGTKQTSVFKDEYFFQDMLLNIAHRNTRELEIPGVDQIPQVIRYFVCALHHRASLWMSEDNIKSRFNLEGHKSWHVANILTHVQSLKDLYNLHQKRVISFGHITSPCVSDHPLDPKQQLVVSLVKRMLSKRKNHYESIGCALDGFDSEDEDDENVDEHLLAATDSPCIDDHIPHLQDDLLDWRKFLLVVGRAGTGKSFTLIKVIDACLSMTGNVFVATPTGFLATQFKDHFPDGVDADTIHAGFRYPVFADERPSYNWNLCNYDLIVIDELSMVPIKIFDHIFATVSELPIRPIVLLAGDDCQLQPIEKIDGQIQSTKTAMRSEKLPAITNKVILTEQHRNDDDDYARFLTHIRSWRPSQHLLDHIQKDRVLFNDEPTDDDILHALTNHPNSTVITVSHKAANRINRVVLNTILDKSLFLADVECDSALGTIPIYKGMRVMITQNRNKQLSVVNGRVAHVLQMEGRTVFLKLANNNIVQVYPVSSPNEDGSLKTVLPFMPAYALTIPKAQGQTLNECIVWLDGCVVAPGGAYVALSRCRKLENVHFMTRVLSSQVTPVSLV